MPAQALAFVRFGHQVQAVSGVTEGLARMQLTVAHALVLSQVPMPRVLELLHTLPGLVNDAERVAHMCLASIASGNAKSMRHVASELDVTKPAGVFWKVEVVTAWANALKDVGGVTAVGTRVVRGCLVGVLENLRQFLHDQPGEFHSAFGRLHGHLGVRGVHTNAHSCTLIWLK
jgi:hypothetical protein